MTQIALSLALALTPVAAPDGVRIDSVISAGLKAWDVPGVAILIVSPDEIIHLKGYGQRELNGKPVTPDTVFPLASCSKAFTTTLVSILADGRQLSWDDPVRKHLPEFHLSDPAADALVTLRDLAAHRTGLSPHDLLWYRAPWSQEEMVRRAGKLPLARPFRTEMQYQSVMYVALGQAAAAAGGKPWAELVTNRLLKPLGMSGVTLTTTEALKSPNHATGHRLGKDGKLAVIPWYEQTAPNPAGSVCASARDLAPWLRLHLNGGKHGTEQIVSEAALRETHSPQTIVRVQGSTKTLNPDTHQISYGLGWVVQDYRGHLLVQHAGLIDGFRVHLTLLPKDGYAFAILANREGTRMNLALSNSLVDLLLGLTAKDWNKHLLEVMDGEVAEAKVKARVVELGRRPGEPPSIPLEQLAGTYEEPAYGSVKVRVEKDSLVWEWGSWKLPLEHYAGDSFRLIEPNKSPLDGVFVRFVVSEGKAREFAASGMVFRRTSD